MKIYLVGGAVRDNLLNLDVKDQDWVVVGGTPEYFLLQGYEQVGADFPVFLHPETKDEYALARKERKVGVGYNGFETVFDTSVTLEEDLFRRDLTINSMAMDDEGKITDPYNGLEDLKNKKLKHVSKHFAEDPLRVLRVARFMARYHKLGFSVHEETMDLMKQMVQSGELNHLTSERVFKELDEKVFKEPNPEQFFYTLKECGALDVVFPEIEQLFGVVQPPEHHPEIDTGIHTMLVLNQAKGISNNNHAVMYAALTHDLGKGITPKELLPQHIGHEKTGMVLVEEMSDRLKVPSYYKKLALKTCELHTKCHRALDLSNRKLYELFKDLDAFRNDKLFNDFLHACESDARGRTGLENREYSQPEYLKHCLDYAKKVDVKKLMEKGLKGAEIGEAIEYQRIDLIQTAKRLYPPNLLEKVEEYKKSFNEFDKLSNTEIIRFMKGFGVDHQTDYLEALYEQINVDNPKILNIAKGFSEIDPSVFLEQGLKHVEISLAIGQAKNDIINKNMIKPSKVIKRKL
jgi:tRNA nucleotidyltransferase (CCA-adding enzyme)